MSSQLSLSNGFFKEYANGLSPFVSLMLLLLAGVEAARWRRAWRDKVLPAIVNFHPDLILISAGFDAHKKDDLACRFVGLQERDYEWVTDQIVQVWS